MEAFLRPIEVTTANDSLTVNGNGKTMTNGVYASILTFLAELEDVCDLVTDDAYLGASRRNHERLVMRLNFAAEQIGKALISNVFGQTSCLFKGNRCKERRAARARCRR